MEFTRGKRESTYMIKGAIVREWLRAPAYLAFGDSATSDLPFMPDAAGPAFRSTRATDSRRRTPTRRKALGRGSLLGRRG